MSLPRPSWNSPLDGGYFVGAEKRSAAAPLEKAHSSCTNQHSSFLCPHLNYLCLYCLQVSSTGYSISVEKKHKWIAMTQFPMQSSALVTSVPIQILFHKKRYPGFHYNGNVAFLYSYSTFPSAEIKPDSHYLPIFILKTAVRHRLGSILGPSLTLFRDWGWAVPENSGQNTWELSCFLRLTVLIAAFHGPSEFLK